MALDIFKVFFLEGGGKGANKKKFFKATQNWFTSAVMLFLKAENFLHFTGNTGIMMESSSLDLT